MDPRRGAVPPRVTTPDVSVSVIRALFGCLETISVGPAATNLRSWPVVSQFEFLTFSYSDMAKDFVHDADKRLCCIDYDAIAGYVFLCSL